MCVEEDVEAKVDESVADITRKSCALLLAHSPLPEFDS